MKTIKISDIIISKRIRKSFSEDKLGVLSDSIWRLGLLHAPVLNGAELVAGGRRLKAIEMLATFGQKLFYQGELVPDGYVPYTEFGSENEEAALEAELEENLHREDLTMPEEMSAKAELHALRMRQNPGQTKLDTAKELSKPGAVVQTTAIRNAILISDNLDDPEVAKAKSEKEAIKIIAKKKTAEKNVALAEEFQTSIADSAESLNVLTQGDMTEWLQGYDSNSFDVIISDPPYGINAQNFNNQEGVAHTYDDTEENFQSIIRTIAVQGYRVAKPAAHAYVFLDFSKWGYVSEQMAAAGWTVWGRPIIWNKRNGLLPRPNHGPRYTYECILFASKGDRTVTEVAADVISISTLTQQRRGAEKPASLYYDLLRRSVRPGDSVLDPCCGLGPVFPAANSLNIRATGIEIDLAAVGYAQARLNLTLAEDEDRRLLEGWGKSDEE